MPSYPDKYKRSVIRRYENGETLKELSNELNIALSTLYRWKDDFSSYTTPKHEYTPHEIEYLYRKSIKSDHKLEIIKDSGYIQAVPLRERLEKLESMYNSSDNTYSVHELCDALEVSRGTFYNHIFRRADQSERESWQKELSELVRETFEESGQRYGAKKIRAILSQQGIKVGAERVSKIMQELGLHSIRPESKKYYLKLQRSEKKNILQRQFSVSAPDSVWVSDITQFRVNGNWIYLCVIIDLFARMVVGYRISQNASTNLVTSAFRKAYSNRGNPENLTFHSDRGKQYTSKTFSALLYNFHVRQSFSASGRPCDNAVAETFFASFKKEEAYRRNYTSEADFIKSVDSYIKFYNEVRPHTSCNFLTPVAYEAKYYEAKQHT